MAVNFQMDFGRGGAPAYLPPEIMTVKPGEGSVLDYSKSDVFSVGVIAFEMLAMGPPFAPYGTYEAARYNSMGYVGLPAEFYELDIRNLVWGLLDSTAETRLTADSALRFIDELMPIKAPEYEVGRDA